METFKIHLDKYLELVPDQPCGQVGKQAQAIATDHFGLPSNSVKHWARIVRLDNWAPPLPASHLEYLGYN